MIKYSKIQNELATMIKHPKIQNELATKMCICLHEMITLLLRFFSNIKKYVKHLKIQKESAKCSPKTFSPCGSSIYRYKIVFNSVSRAVQYPH